MIQADPERIVFVCGNLQANGSAVYLPSPVRRSSPTPKDYLKRILAIIPLSS
jgi:hypothetical protein